MNPVQHVAVIMDGNGRWGLKNKKSRNLGHKAGLKTVEMIIKESIKKKIKFITLYAFSTENWKRPSAEKKFLFNLLEVYLKEKLDQLNRNKIKIKIIGNKAFSKNLNNILNNAERITKKNDKLQINLALNYGSKTEIINALNKLKKSKGKITEKKVSQCLYTNNVPDPDFLIRTGNTSRLSNFLLWQLAYSEIFFEKKLWPDFNKNDYLRIINKFKKIKRNFGNI